MTRNCSNSHPRLPRRKLTLPRARFSDRDLLLILVAIAALIPIIVEFGSGI